jgi:hypothetical protein
MNPKSNINRWFIVVGTGMLGLACMLLAGVTLYDQFAGADPVPGWAIPVSVAGGVAAGGLFTYALQKICSQWLGLNNQSD